MEQEKVGTSAKVKIQCDIIKINYTNSQTKIQQQYLLHPQPAVDYR